MEGQDRMSAEQSKADLTEVKERVVPAALRSRLLGSGSLKLFVCACECAGLLIS